VTDPLSTTFAALADPTRRAILARLARGSSTVKELSEPFDMSGPAISKHLRVLERAGLITQGRRAQWRPCQLEAAPLREVAEWTEAYRRFWEGSFDRLGDYLDELQGRAPKTAPVSPPKRGASSAKPAKSAARKPAKPTKSAARKPAKSAARKPRARAEAGETATKPTKSAAQKPSKRAPKPAPSRAARTSSR